MKNLKLFALWVCMTIWGVSSVFGQSQTLVLSGNTSLVIDKTKFVNVSGGCEVSEGHYAFFNEGTGSNWNNTLNNICDNDGVRYIKRLVKGKTLSIKVQNLNSFTVSFKSTSTGTGKGLSYVIKDLTDPSVANMTGMYPASVYCNATTPVSPLNPTHEYQIVFTSTETDNFISRVDMAYSSLSSQETMSGSFQVGGSFDRFYPVVFKDTQWSENEPTILELTRYDTHSDSYWRGSLDARFTFHVTNWGNASEYINAEIYQRNSSDVEIPFIADWLDMSPSNASRSVIIWLRGGATTYNFHSNGKQTPMVYDGEQHELPYVVTEGPDWEESETVYNYKTAVSEKVNSSGLNFQNNIWAFGNQHYFAGKVGIETTDPKYTLDVKGKIHAKEVLIDLDEGADFVFEKNYKLMNLNELDEYVKTNKHLPDIPSAAEMTDKGVDMDEFQVKLLQKIEELTLYTLQQQEEIRALRSELEKLK